MTTSLTIHDGPNGQRESVPATDFRLAWSEEDRPSPAQGGTGHEIDFQARLDADYLTNRRRYLEWVHTFGATATRGGRTIRQTLSLPGVPVSFWWLSLLAEKSPLKSGVILSAFKLMSLERMLAEFSFASIVLVSRNGRLATTVRRLCADRGLAFRWIRVGRSAPERWRSHLPHLLAAVLWLLVQFFKRIRVARQSRLRTARTNAREATIVTYVPNHEAAAAERHAFRSRYWGSLHDWLDQQKDLTVNWVWIHVDAPQASFTDMCRLRQDFQASGKDNYFLAEEFLTPDDFFRALAMYLRLFRRSPKLLSDPNVRAAFRLPESSLDLYPLLHEEWAISFQGVTAIDNCLWLRKFQRLSEALPAKQDWGLYLCEFEAWETALCATWKQRVSWGRLVGYQHATVSELMLNYYHDRRTLQDVEGDPMILPDVLAVNGPLAFRNLLFTGYPPDRIVEVEALRYAYLNNLTRDAAENSLPPGHRGRLLIACDMVPANTRRQLALLADALVQMPESQDAFENIWVKPHPFCAVGPFLEALGLSSRVQVVGGSVAEWALRATHIFTGNSTSVALEALALGRQVACAVSLDEMNLSPLLGLRNSALVHSPGQLIAFLQSPRQPPATDTPIFNFSTPLPSVLDAAARTGPFGYAQEPVSAPHHNLALAACRA